MSDGNESGARERRPGEPPAPPPPPMEELEPIELPTEEPLPIELTPQPQEWSGEEERENGQAAERVEPESGGAAGQIEEMEQIELEEPETPRELAPEAGSEEEPPEELPEELPEAAPEEEQENSRSVEQEREEEPEEQEEQEEEEEEEESQVLLSVKDLKASGPPPPVARTERLERPGEEADTEAAVTVSLSIISPAESRRSEILQGERITIGRGRSMQMRLNQPQVSEHHASIVFRSGGFFIEDFTSERGTRVNGEKILRRQLNNGDFIEISPYRLVFESHVGEKPAKRAGPVWKPAPIREPVAEELPGIVRQHQRRGVTIMIICFCLVLVALVAATIVIVNILHSRQGPESAPPPATAPARPGAAGGG